MGNCLYFLQAVESGSGRGIYFAHSCYVVLLRNDSDHVGLLEEYVGRIFINLKHLPQYVIRDKLNVEVDGNS